MKKFSILFIFSLAFIPSTSFGATALKLCAKGTTVTAKTACASGEKVLTLGGLEAATKTTCGLRYGDATGTGKVDVSAACNTGESFVSHGAYSNNSNGVIQSVELRLLLDGKTVGGVTYTFVDPTLGDAPLDVTAQVLCCATK